MEKQRVLVVDDNEFIRASMEKFLETNTNKDENGKKLTEDAQKLKYENFVKQTGEEYITVDQAIEKYL